MNYDEYIKVLETLKAENEGFVIGVIPDIKKFAYDAIIDWIDNNLSTQRGNLIASDETIAALNDFDAAYLRVLGQFGQYRKAVSDMVAGLHRISSTVKEYQENSNNISWAEANIRPSEKLVVEEIMKAYTDNGLNAEFVQPLRNQIYRNIVAGTKVREAKDGLKTYIQGGNDKSGKLSRYLTQTSQQAVDSYTGMINKKLMETFDYPFLIMSGSLIKTSSPQCVEGIDEYGGVISKELFENELKQIAEKNGLIKGTKWTNLPFNKFHWACRHEFTPAMTRPVRYKK